MRQRLVLFLTLLLASCAATTIEPGMDNGPDVGGTYYTLCTLHPDPAKQTLSSLNYLQAGVIPRGSEVTIDDRTEKQMVFTHVETGVQYTWVHSNHLTGDLATTLTKYFGSMDDVAPASAMSEKDQEGIRLNTTLEGMSKDGVLMAIGAPPDHATPSLDLPVWSYWKNRWARRVLTFDENGIVKQIDG